MKIKQITETSTTAGSIAPVQGVLGSTQTRGNPSIYGGKKVGNLFKGKTTSKPYANSLNEAAMKDLSYDLEVMKPAEFQKKYGKSREEVKAALSRQPKPAQPTTPPINEADLSEQDLIMVPGQGKKLKPGFISKADDRTDHEVEMARSDLFQAAKNAKQVFSMIKDVSEDEGLEGWVQEKIIKANDYLNTIREYLEGKQVQGVAEGYSNTTFNVDRRKLNVPALIQKGAIFVTYPHGEQGWETDNKEDWAFSLLSLYNVLQGGWASEAKKYLKPESYKRAEQQINSSAPNLGSDKLVYDGKYNQILWSIKKLGIPDNVAFLDKDKQGVAEGEGNKYGSQENWDSLRKDIRSQYPYKKGTTVTVPHKGKLVNGKIVRYEAGGGGYSPAYVVDIGEYESLMVEPNKVRRGVAEGAKVDRMVKHVAKSEKKLGKSKDEAENIAWATANKRGMLDNKNKKA